ncbi:hypothetical protein Dsin_015374 [Dipteronia sinensis]|uniref:Reverse transcriptase domain-containing protein n=1 Tax=Dipteronia sinensis TaxID=43782 RepID=A0AAE0E5W8_9ROSI|nr:hypothetical protein Dsin_015374 [Dipteronia sinensis]
MARVKLNPASMGEFRPISLVGTVYKILAKDLANRFKRVMNSVIGEYQMTFVKGCRIIDSFVIAEEIINHWKRENEGGLVVKLNFEKAYDSVDHGFLDSMLEMMGFSPRWRGLIGWCISSPSLSVLGDGNVKRKLHTVAWDSVCRSKDKVANLFNNISRSDAVLKEGMKMVMGDVAKMSSWNDIRKDAKSLHESFPRIFA